LSRREYSLFGPARLLRLLHINRVLVRHGLDDIILATHLFRPIGFLRHLLPWNWVPRPQSELPPGARIRLALEDLGPIFVKFGQMLSTRRDLLPDDIALELARLQSRRQGHLKLMRAVRGQLRDIGIEAGEGALAA